MFKELVKKCETQEQIDSIYEYVYCNQKDLYFKKTKTRLVNQKYNGPKVLNNFDRQEIYNFSRAFENHNNNFKEQ